MEKMLENTSGEFVKIQIHVYDEYYEIGKLHIIEDLISNQCILICTGIAQNNDFIYEFEINMSEEHFNFGFIDPSFNGTIPKSELKVYKNHYKSRRNCYRDLKARWIYLRRLKEEWYQLTPYKKEIPEDLQERVLNIYLRFERLKFFWMKSLK